MACTWLYATWLYALDCNLNRRFSAQRVEGDGSAVCCWSHALLSPWLQGADGSWPEGPELEELVLGNGRSLAVPGVGE